MVPHHIGQRKRKDMASEARRQNARVKKILNLKQKRVFGLVNILKFLGAKRRVFFLFKIMILPLI